VGSALRRNTARRTLDQVPKFLTVTCFPTHDGIPDVAHRGAPVDAGRHTDQGGEATADDAQRRVADRETDFGDAEVATTQQRHRALDAPSHQVEPYGDSPLGEPELAAEVPNSARLRGLGSSR
jgi:hypothetical protein